MLTARFRWLSGLLLVCLVLSASPDAQAPAESGYVPHRVFDIARKQFTDFEAMLADLSGVDVVAVGEQHDDPATHRLELALLEGMVRLKRPVIVSLEMFERDVQKALDDYLASRVSEAAFLAGSRPWPRYATDYRGLVELADRQAWKVVAGNIPRRIAADIGKQGLAAVDALPAADKALVAAERHCPLGDDYHMRFEKEMQQHPPAPGQEAAAKAMAERFYYAQCLKDETMAEAILSAVRAAADPKPLVVHYNGAFHSDYRAGVVARLERRLTGGKIRVVSMVPVEKLESLDPSSHAGRADYVVFTIKPEPAVKKNP